MPELKVTPVQARAIVALMTERDVKAAAKAVGCGERTIYRWLTEPAFQAALKQAQAAATDAAIRRLADATGTAVDVLKHVMGDAAASPNARIRAADVVLGRLMDLRQLSEFEARLTAIEQELRQTQGGRK